VKHPEENQLIFDWAQFGPNAVDWPEHVMLDDETLRDGLQSPSVIDPSLETKVAVLHLMDRLGIETADIGLPGAGKRQLESVTRLCREISDNRMNIRPNCAARTLMVDIQPIAEVSQRTGIPIEACVFIGSSPIRQYAEEWDLDHILRFTRDAVRFAVGEGLPVMYVTEDTVRSSPDDLRVLLTAAIEAGAQRVCLCDTVGAAVPEGVMNLVAWVKDLIDELDVDVGIDWHGHRDRGLDMSNTLAAIKSGATRVHGTALGIGERVGNTPMEQLLVNLRLLAVRDDDLTCLPDYLHIVSQSTGVPIPISKPIIGRDAFRTATGVHAAAVIKAQRKGDAWLADLI
jgi:2-isopropylmalate synthase